MRASSPKSKSPNVRFPSEDIRDVTIFCRYFEVGFGLPTHDFFHGLLNYYGVQVAHLSLNLYLHMSIFIHLIEPYLGIDPYFELFLNIFGLKSIPKDDDPKYIGGSHPSVQAEDAGVVRVV